MGTSGDADIRAHRFFALEGRLDGLATWSTTPVCWWRAGDRNRIMTPAMLGSRVVALDFSRKGILAKRRWCVADSRGR